MNIPQLESIKEIDKKYETGERPVLVLCSDLKNYICKYKISSLPSYKLTCELIGSLLAKLWNLNIPNFALIRIKQNHWGNLNLPHQINTPSFGSLQQINVIDLNPTTFSQVNSSQDNLIQLLKIALFDFWVANEDRNYNNANLMYDVIRNKIIPIDFGCIFNTATFEYPLSQLTETDSIINSDLFKHLIRSYESNVLEGIIVSLKKYLFNEIDICQKEINDIITLIPKDWIIEKENIHWKLEQLFNKKWIEQTWDNFITTLEDYI